MIDFDDGNGPVTAHKHTNGGGWVSDSASVDERVCVGPNARVYGDASVSGNDLVLGDAKVYGNTEINSEKIKC